MKFPTVKTLPYLFELNLSVFIAYFVVGKNKKLKSKAVTLLFETIGNIHAIQIEAKGLMEKSEKKFDKYETVYREGLKKITHLHDFLLNKYKVEQLELRSDSLDGNIFQVYKKWSECKEDKTTIDCTYNFIVKPVKKLINEFESSENSIVLMDLTIPCEESYKNLKKIDEYLSKEYRYYARACYKSFIRTSLILILFETKKKICYPYSYFRGHLKKVADWN